MPAVNLLCLSLCETLNCPAKPSETLLSLNAVFVHALACGVNALQNPLSAMVGQLAFYVIPLI